MTLQEALAVAARAKPIERKRREPLDKLRFDADVAALNKSYETMGETLSGLQKRIDQIAADVEYIENFTQRSIRRRALQ